MDTDRKLKFNKELKKRANELWKTFLSNMGELGYKPTKTYQEIDFHNSAYKKIEMEGHLKLKADENDEKL